MFKQLRKFSTGFLRLKKFFSVYVFKIRLICIQNVMYVMLATLKQFDFCYLLRFIIISSVHGTFHFLLMCIQKTLDSNIFTKKVLRKF